MIPAMPTQEYREKKYSNCKIQLKYIFIKAGTWTRDYKIDAVLQHDKNGIGTNKLSLRIA